MKSWLEAFRIALSMYSAIPVKSPDWNEKNLRHAFVFFPFIGLCCAGVVWVIWTLCQFLQIGSVLFGVLAVVGTVALTGGIHLDGFCDTTDALCSRKPMEEKLCILKDPHCGPFAVLRVVLVLLVQLGAYGQLYATQSRFVIGLLLGGFVISRCMSGICVTLFPSTSTSSLAKTFGERAGKHVGIVLIVIFGITGLVLIHWYHWLVLVLVELSILQFIGFRKMQEKEFGGMTGDLAGYFLVQLETVWLLVTALLGKVMLCS